MPIHEYKGLTIEEFPAYGPWPASFWVKQGRGDRKFDSLQDAQAFIDERRQRRKKPHASWKLFRF
jgi:hypothetical protein